MSNENYVITPLAAHRGAAEQLLVRVLSATCPAPLWTPQPTVDIPAAVAEVLDPFSTADPDLADQLSALGTGRAAWVALAGDRAAALLSLTLRNVRPGDPEYSYLPPAYAALGMAGTLVDRRSDLPALHQLFRYASISILAAGIDQVSVQLRVGDWVTGSFWRERGFGRTRCSRGAPRRPRWPPRTRCGSESPTDRTSMP